jgi:hypothetical protein
VTDLKGIEPSICMHCVCIHLEDDAKPSCEVQRQLNPQHEGKRKCYG